jgi:hypothetical protein
MRQRKWSELSTPQRVAVVVGGTLQLALQAWVVRDLRRRSREEVRGPRWAWAGAALVNPVGPLAYLAVGRRNPPRPPLE